MALSETGDNSISMNGSSVSAVRSVSGSVNENNELVITVNGVSGAGIPLDDVLSVENIATLANITYEQVVTGLRNPTDSTKFTTNTDKKFFSVGSQSLVYGIRVVNDNNESFSMESSGTIDYSFIGIGTIKGYLLTDQSELESVKEQILSQNSNIAKYLNNTFSEISNGHYYVTLAGYVGGTYYTYCGPIKVEFDANNNTISNVTIDVNDLYFIKGGRFTNAGFNLCCFKSTISKKGFILPE